MRESEPKKNSSWKTKCWPEEFPFWTTLLNDFQGRFLRVFDVFPWFNVWGSQKCQENILFRKKSWSFWSFKNSVHLGLKEQIFNRNCFDWFGSCGSPNRAYDGFLEIPICLVCYSGSDLLGTHLPSRPIAPKIQWFISCNFMTTN